VPFMHMEVRALFGRIASRAEGTNNCLSYAHCGGLEMAPHENKWSLLDGAHE